MVASPFSRWMMMGSSVFTFVLLSLPKINFALHRTGDRWLAVHISQRIVFPKRPKNPAEVIHLILRVLNYYCLLQGFLHHLMQRNLPRPFLSGSLIPRRPHSLREHILVLITSAADARWKVLFIMRNIHHAPCQYSSPLFPSASHISAIDSISRTRQSPSPHRL